MSHPSRTFPLATTPAQQALDTTLTRHGWEPNTDSRMRVGAIEYIDPRAYSQGHWHLFFTYTPDQVLRDAWLVRASQRPPSARADLPRWNLTTLGCVPDFDAIAERPEVAAWVAAERAWKIDNAISARMDIFLLPLAVRRSSDTEFRALAAQARDLANELAAGSGWTDTHTLTTLLSDVTRRLAELSDPAECGRRARTMNRINADDPIYADNTVPHV